MKILRRNKELIITILLVIVLSGGLTAGAGYIILRFNEAQCHELATLNPSRHFQFKTFGGCYVETNSGLWITTDNNWHIELDK